MKSFIFFLVIVILGVLQLTVVDYFKVFNLRPDLFLIAAVMAGLIFNLRRALAFSIFAGMLKDVFGVTGFGLNSLLFFLWGLLIARLSREVSLDNNFIRIGLVFIIAVMHNTISGIIFIYSGNFVPLGIFLRIVCFGSLYTALISPLVFKAVSTVIHS
jgi:rod shape-determining protein MreD